MEKILLSAMKQSLRLWLPQLSPLMTFQNLIKLEMDYDLRCIAHLKEDEDKVLFRDLANNQKSTLVMIGPEGGFSDDEISSAERLNYQSIALGSARLRTETAGIVVCTIFANS